VRYLLDTNAVVAALRDRTSRVALELRRHAPSEVGIPVIVAYELYYGALHSSRPDENLARVNALRFEILPFGRDDALQAGRIRAELRERGTLIGPYDLLIAGQAVARRLVLVTNNVREFSRIAELTLEDWTIGTATGP
jgi:tRNA(fMet)-specific endonuclease VapC